MCFSWRNVTVSVCSYDGLQFFLTNPAKVGKLILFEFDLCLEM